MQMLFIALFRIVTMFSNFQAGFPTISHKLHGIFAPNFKTWREKMEMRYCIDTRQGSRREEGGEGKKDKNLCEFKQIKG